MKEGVACYQDYLRGLLDLTDNLRRRQRSCRRRRWCATTRDDPYLVVAADKGTATFSDYANAISKEYGLLARRRVRLGRQRRATTTRRWASPRAARGRAVKRHFREMGVDTQTHRLHRGRHRRHVGRRVRQRHAAVAAHPAGGGVRPPPHLHRSRIPTRRRVTPSASGCSSCRARRGPTTTRS